MADSRGTSTMGRPGRVLVHNKTLTSESETWLSASECPRMSFGCQSAGPISCLVESQLFCWQRVPIPLTIISLLGSSTLHRQGPGDATASKSTSYLQCFCGQIQVDDAVVCSLYEVYKSLGQQSCKPRPDTES